MAPDLSGRVTFANGMAACGVEVRVFNQDAPGKGDDDLTITPGISDESGFFQVRYDPGRYKDFASLPFVGLGSSGRNMNYGSCARRFPAVGRVFTGAAA